MRAERRRRRAPRSRRRRWSGRPTAASAPAPPPGSAGRPSSACRPWRDATRGPSWRITWPIWKSRSRRISHGPSTRLMTQRRHAGRRGAERDVARHVEDGDLRVERDEEVIQHQPNSAVRRSTTRSVRVPREPLTSTTSPDVDLRGDRRRRLGAGREVRHRARAACPASIAASPSARAGSPPTVISCAEPAAAAARPHSRCSDSDSVAELEHLAEHRDAARAPRCARSPRASAAAPTGSSCRSRRSP